MTERDPMPTVAETTRLALTLVSQAEPLLFDLWQTHALTLTQLRCLKTLTTGPRTAGDLATQLGLQAASLTRILGRLEAQGLVTRVTGQEDRRTVVVSLTEQGHSTLGALTLGRDHPLARGIRALAPEDQRCLHQGLAALIEAIAQIATDPPSVPTSS